MTPDRNDPPPHLPDDAKTLWPSLIDELDARGTLPRVARHRLAIYCQLFAQYFRVTGFINSNGQVLEIRNDKGELKRQEIAPEAVQQLKLVESLRRFDKEFGLTEDTQTAQEGREAQTKGQAVDPFQQIENALRARMAAGAQSHD